MSGAPTETSVAEATRPDDDLGLLTAALGDPGIDLEELLGVLADQLAGAWPACAGLTMTVVHDGVAVTLTVGGRDLLVTSNAFLNLPLCTQTQNKPDGRVAFYAAQVRDFADLAAVVTGSAGRDRSIAQSRSAHSLGVSGLAEFSARNQAIGVLVEQGHTPDEARTEIRRRSARSAGTLTETSQDILNSLQPSWPRSVHTARSRQSPSAPTRRSWAHHDR